MLWLFLKSSNNSCLLLNMKDNLSESCSQNPYTVWVVTSLATASLLSSGKVFIQISKWTHFVNWTSSSCTSVAIELIADLFMWHQHKWTLACFCMPSACSMQSIFDLVHALLCHWTVNLWMFLRATSSQSKCVMSCPCSLSELDRSWLQYVVIQQQLLTEELFSQLPMYLLLKHPCNNKMKRRLSTWLLHKLNFEF